MGVVGCSRSGNWSVWRRRGMAVSSMWGRAFGSAAIAAPGQGWRQHVHDDRGTRFARLALATVAFLMFQVAAAQAEAALKIDVLSNRADLISGGDALVAISA